MKTMVSQAGQEIKGNIQEECVFFPEGIIGFPECKQYAIVAGKSKEPFYWLQSAENPELSFIVIDPKDVKTDYCPALSQADKSVLRVEDISQCKMFSIVHVPKESDKISANLLAPLLINKKENIGRQVVLQEQDFSIKHLIFEEAFAGTGENHVGSFAKA